MAKQDDLSHITILKISEKKLIKAINEVNKALDDPSDESLDKIRPDKSIDRDCINFDYIHKCLSAFMTPATINQHVCEHYTRSQIFEMFKKFENTSLDGYSGFHKASFQVASFDLIIETVNCIMSKLGNSPASMYVARVVLGSYFFYGCKTEKDVVLRIATKLIPNKSNPWKVVRENVAPVTVVSNAVVSKSQNNPQLVAAPAAGGSPLRLFKTLVKSIFGTGTQQTASEESPSTVKFEEYGKSPINMMYQDDNPYCTFIACVTSVLMNEAILPYIGAFMERSDKDKDDKQLHFREAIRMLMTRRNSIRISGDDRIEYQYSMHVLFEDLKRYDEKKFGYLANVTEGLIPLHAIRFVKDLCQIMGISVVFGTRQGDKLYTYKTNKPNTTQKKPTRVVPEPKSETPKSTTEPNVIVELAPDIFYLAFGPVEKGGVIDVVLENDYVRAGIMISSATRPLFLYIPNKKDKIYRHQNYYYERSGPLSLTSVHMISGFLEQGKEYLFNGQQMNKRSPCRLIQLKWDDIRNPLYASLYLDMGYYLNDTTDKCPRFSIKTVEQAVDDYLSDTKNIKLYVKSIARYNTTPKHAHYVWVRKSDVVFKMRYIDEFVLKVLMSRKNKELVIDGYYYTQYLDQVYRQEIKAAPDIDLATVLKTMFYYKSTYIQGYVKQAKFTINEDIAHSSMQTCGVLLYRSVLMHHNHYVADDHLVRYINPEEFKHMFSNVISFGIFNNLQGYYRITQIIYTVGYYLLNPNNPSISISKDQLVTLYTFLISAFNMLVIAHLRHAQGLISLKQTCHLDNIDGFIRIAKLLFNAYIEQERMLSPDELKKIKSDNIRLEKDLSETIINLFDNKTSLCSIGTSGYQQHIGRTVNEDNTTLYGTIIETLDFYNTDRYAWFYTYKDLTNIKVQNDIATTEIMEFRKVKQIIDLDHSCTNCYNFVAFQSFGWHRMAHTGEFAVKMEEIDGSRGTASKECVAAYTISIQKNILEPLTQFKITYMKKHIGFESSVVKDVENMVDNMFKNMHKAFQMTDNIDKALYGIQDSKNENTCKHITAILLQLFIRNEEQFLEKAVELIMIFRKFDMVLYRHKQGFVRMRISQWMLVYELDKIVGSFYTPVDDFNITTMLNEIQMIDIINRYAPYFILEFKLKN